MTNATFGGDLPVTGDRVPPGRRRGGRMPADPPSSRALRASDADRDRVIELLRAAVADGRLDPVEFDERLDAALAARTIDALAPLIADLTAMPGSDGALTLPLAGTPAEQAAELLTINERHGSVRRGGSVELVLAPGMVVDANELAVRHSKLAISRDAGDNTPETLRVRLVGRMRHGRIDTRWLTPRR